MAQRDNEAVASSTHSAAVPGTVPDKRTKKKKKKRKARGATSDSGVDSNKRRANTEEEPKIRKLVVKQSSTNKLQAKPAELARPSSPSTSRVIPIADGVPIAGVDAPSERPILETEGYSTGVYQMLLETKRAELLCESVMLHYNQVARLKRQFDSEDSFQSGEITQDEFFSLIGEEKRKLSQGMFQHVGLPNNMQRLKFDDFVLCVVTFSTLSRPELLHYAFTLFDQDESGAMDERELVAFCGDLKNKDFFFEKNVQVAQKKLAIGGAKHGQHLQDGLVDYQDIANGSAQFPVAFYPILQFQRNIRAATLGEAFWIKIEERRQRVEVIVHYMRLHDGHLPPLSIPDYVRALFSREVYGLRRIAVVKYADEKRIWDLERAKAAAEKAARLDHIAETEL